MADPKLPVYKCCIDEDLESEVQVEFVSFVDKPAIDRTFLAFKDKIRFSVDTEKRIVSGPAMIADMLIYRNDPERLGEYYTTFDKAAILSIVQKFFRKGFIQNFNVMHSPDSKTSGVTIFESFITDELRGIHPMKGFEDVAEGSWFISAKVDDQAIWEKVKSGEVKGFSVEGVFNQLPVKMHKISPEVAMEKIKAILESMEE
jgi:hypothetical protein